MFKKSETRRNKSGVYIGEGKGLFNSILRQFGVDRSVVIPSSYSGPVGIIGGSGSGKTQCSVLPTLCQTYRDGNFFAIDIKGDLLNAYMESSPGEVVKVFSLRGESEYTYDPFDFIREDEDANLVSNMRELVNALLPIPTNIKDPFWIQSSREYLTGGLLYYYDLNSGEGFIDAAVNVMTTPPATLITKISKCGNDQIKSFVNNFIGINNYDNKVLVGIGQEITNRLSIIANDPRVRQALSPSEKQIRWTDLEEYNIFLSVPEDRLEQYGPVIAMMNTQLIRSLERCPEKHSSEGAGQRKKMLMLDETARLGKIDVLQSAVSTLRSKNVIICLVFQSLAQLDAVYGQDVQRIILDNCSYLVVFGANDVQNQRYFAERAGTVLVKRYSTSMSYTKDSGTIDPNEPFAYHTSLAFGYDNKKKVTGYSEQISTTREYAIQPHEFGTLKDIVFYTPDGYKRVKKEPYYKKKHENRPKWMNKVSVAIKKVVDTVINPTVRGARTIIGKAKSFISSLFGWGIRRYE